MPRFNRQRKIKAWLRSFNSKPFWFKSLSLGGIFVGLVIVSYAFSLLFRHSNSAVLGTITSQGEWEAGEYATSTIDTKSSVGDLQIQSGGVGTWDASTSGFPTDTRGRYDRVPEPPDRGADLTTDGTYIYMIKGGHEPALFRYNPELVTWKQLADAPSDLYEGSALTYYDGFLYVIPGHYDAATLDESGELFAYDILNNVWSKKAGLTAGEFWGRGADLESDMQGHLFAIQGEGQNAFWMYTIADNSWSQGAVRPVFATGTSHPLVYSSTSFGTNPIYCEQGCIYAFVGGARTFFRYDIAFNGGQWFYSFADVPSTFGNIAVGSAMVHDPINGALYGFRGGNTEFFKYTIGDPGVWDTATGDTENSQITTSYGAALTYLDGYIYATFTTVPELGRYNVASTHWENIYSPVSPGTNTDGLIAYVPYSAAGGSDCTYAGGCLFVAQGGGNALRRFNLSTSGAGARTWDTLATMPGNPGAGGSMCYDGTDNIYILQGGSQNVYVYTIDPAGAGSFGANLTVPGATGAGASITCMGDNEFYVLRGNSTQNLYHYHGVWDTEALIPALSVNAGAAIAHVGSTVYALAGNYRGNFYQFDGTSWSALPDLPTSSYHTANIEYDGVGNLYAIVGKYSREFWRYDISEQTWSKASDLQERAQFSNGITTDVTNGKMYILRGWGYNMIRIFNVESDNYIPQATWISEPIDLVYIDTTPGAGFDNFTTTETLNGQTINYFSRTSDDGVAWNDWAQINSGVISSDPKRYIQIKVVLNSNGTATPVLSDFSVNYHKDPTAPTNPTIHGYANSAKTITVTSGSTSHYTTPYFELTGASDTESGVVGYYVAWSDSASAPGDLTTNSNYWQTSTIYQVNTPLSSGTTYHLYVATKNGSGTTAAVTSFNYTYAGITTNSTHIWSTEEDFNNGTSQSIDWTSSSGNVTLAHITDGIWTNEAPTPNTLGNGSSIVFDGNDTIYLLRASASQAFYKYSLTTKTYTTLANYGVNVTTGSSAVFVPYGDHCSAVGGCVFATQGGSAVFKRYTSDVWTSMANVGAPGVNTNVSSGGSMVFDGDGTIYLLPGNSTKFYKYVIDNNEWIPLTEDPQTIGLGGTLAYVPYGDYCSASVGCFFATQGGNTTHFLKSIGNVWTYAADAPVTIGDGAASYYLNGYIYILRGAQLHEFLRYDILNNFWEYLTPISGGKLYGSSQSIVYDAATAKMYTFRGYGEYSLLRYDVPSNTWDTPELPHYYTTASLLGFLNGTTAYDSTNKVLYVSRGQTSPDWWAFNLTTRQWQKKTDVPHTVTNGADAHYINGYIYLMPGNEALNDNIGYFYKYNPSTDMWARLSNMPGEPGDGADLVWDGNNTIYTAQGNNSNVFYSYTINTNTWNTINSVPNVPVANVRYGGCVARASDGISEYLYLAKANNTDRIHRYDFSSGTPAWSPNNNSYSTMPGAIQYGGACVNDGQGNILIPRGSNNTTPTNDMYVYNAAGNSWTTRSTLADFYYGNLTMTNDNVIRGFRGRSTSSMEEYVVATATTGFTGRGIWTSEIIDLEPSVSEKVYELSGLTITDSLATDTQSAVSYETRTCTDAVCSVPSEWASLTALHTVGSADYYSISSPKNRYFQIRAILTSDQIKTPTINDITLNYYVDGTAPNNPTNLVVRDSSGGSVDLESGNWNHYTSPYFVWSGASDNTGGIGLAGYYVYFGADPDVDPASSENYFQSDATYSASGLVTGNTYYLKIKTKDYAGNVSDYWRSGPGVDSQFVYSFDNVRPGRPTNLQVTPAVPTATNSFSITWTAANDAGGAPYFEYCYMRYLDGTHFDASETCMASSQTALNNIQALGEGTNTFRIRSKDAAGNYSNNDEWETVLYRYAVTPPSLPTNVQHGEVSGNPYSHNFTWSEPATHAFDITNYCYQVNVEPTATICNFGTYGGWTGSDGLSLLDLTTPNTHQGTNYLYIVAKDEAGNVNWDANYDCDAGLGCISFTSTTISPNPPQNFSLIDASDRLTSTYRITLGWNKPEDNPGSQLNQYTIYRSSNGVNYTVRETIQNRTDQDEYAYTDVSLDNATTYYYKITAVDLAGAESSATTVLSLRPEGRYTSAPSLVGEPTVQARIRSAVISWLTDDPDTHPASSFVMVGKTSSLELTPQGNPDLTGEHSVTLLDLQPNTMYYYKLKWIDQDNNIGYSVINSFRTNDAPSAPLALNVSPTDSTDNNFTFTWQPPVDEGVTIGGYYYSINSVPTEDNTTFISATTLGPLAAATKQGTNIFYIVATDDSGNHNFNNYASKSFTVNTPAPSTPSSVSITDSSDRASSDFALTLRWSRLTSIDHYNVYRSDNNISFVLVSETDTNAYLDTGLDSETTYYYKITAEDNAKSEGQASSVVSKKPTGRYLMPPSYTEGPEISVTSSTATIEWATDRASSSFILYGKSIDLNESKGQLDATLSHKVELTGLNPSMKYYFKLQSFDEARDYNPDQALSEQYEFTTSVAPAIADVKITDIRQTTAYVQWKTTTVSTSVLKYGKTNDYGETIDDTSSGATTVHTVKLEGLESESLYHVKIIGTDTEGNLLQSDDYSFQTLAFPRIFNVQFQPVADASSATVMVVWETNVKTDTIIEFAPEGQAFAESVKSTLDVKHEITVNNLLDNTRYLLRAKGRDEYGNLATSDLINYATPFDTRPPKISDITIETAVIGTGKEAKGQVIVSWKTDELSSSQVEYSEGVGGDSYSNKTVEDVTMTNSHMVIVSDLSPSKPYHIRVLSHDNAGNESKSEDHAVITGRATESVLDLIIVNLQETFGWLGNIGKLFKF